MSQQGEVYLGEPTAPPSCVAKATDVTVHGEGRRDSTPPSRRRHVIGRRQRQRHQHGRAHEGRGCAPVPPRQPTSPNARKGEEGLNPTLPPTEALSQGVGANVDVTLLWAVLSRPSAGDVTTRRWPFLFTNRALSPFSGRRRVLPEQ